MTERDPVSPGHVRAIIQRHLTEEETVSFEGMYVGTVEAEAAVTTQLALCRAHMIAYNEQVRLVDAKKEQELLDSIEAKGKEVQRLQAAIAEAEAKLGRLDKRLRATG